MKSEADTRKKEFPPTTRPDSGQEEIELTVEDEKVRLPSLQLLWYQHVRGIYLSFFSLLVDIALANVSTSTRTVDHSHNDTDQNLRYC